MNKRTLMLSAAAVALLSAPALADTTLTTVSTTSHKTSTDGNLTINSGAGIDFKSATVPMLTLDSNSSVNNGGVLTGSGQTTETAVVIDATGLTGSFTNNGTIDLSGTGSSKTAVYLQGASFFTGNITLDTGSIISVTGDSSRGILTDTGSILNGDLLLGGALQMAPTTANESASSGVTIASLLGTINGNVIVSAGASYTATGNGAQGIVIAGPLQHCNTAAVPTCTEIGTFSNSGSIAVAGIGTRSTTSVNAESGSALIVGNSVAGGILNNGPSSTADSTTAAGISGNGVNSGVIVITPEAGVAMTIGVDAADAANGTFSFINRGTITATPEDPNKGTRTILIGGALATPVTFNGGFFSSGIIAASASSVSPGTAVSAGALEIDSYVTLPEIHVSAQSVSAGGSTGTIAASIQGPMGGVANAIFIGGADFAGGTTTTSVPLITVESGARIVASASVTDPSSTNVTSLSAIAIEDRSNSLVHIVNQGTITAQVTTLTNGLTGVAHAVDASFNTVGMNFQNSGVVNGDILFGSGSDTYTVQGSGPSSGASHIGAINFGFSTGGIGADTLHVAQFANVAGAITAQGTLDVTVDGTGILSVQNVGSTLATRNFSLAGGTSTSAGTLNVTVSQGLGGASVISASNAVNFGLGANLNVKYGSFITAGGTFNLISAPTGALNISSTDVARYNAAVGGATTLPFLFNSASIVKTNDGAGHDLLQLNVSAKTVGTAANQLNITGYARTMFPLANAAIVNDPNLGSALIAGITSTATAQAAYDAFAPDVSGGTRYLAISLTDQATGVVAARQRALRLFGKQPGDLTLWGNEFGEYVSTKTTVSTNPIDPGPLNGFKDHGFGFSLGMDEGSAAGGWYGAAFTFYTGDIAEGGDRVSKASTLWYMLSAYSDWRGKGLFFDSQLTLGYGNLKGKRFIDLTIPGSTTTASTTFSREADSKRAALLASLGATLGANLHSGSFTAIPQISLDGLTMREEGFTETGGGSGFNLAVTPYYANSLRIFLGSEFREDINVGDFFLQPSARLGYRFDLLNDPVKLHAAFADIDPNTTGNQAGTAFTIQGPDPSRGNYVAGLNLAATTENWTIGLNYDFVRGSNNATEQVGTLSLLGRI